MGGETAATPHEMTMLDWALEYARAGFRILPVHTIRNGVCSCAGSKACKPGKHPIANLVRHGSKDAATDENTIRAWWHRVPDANIAVATGKESGVVVIDIDGPEGEASFAELEKLHGPIPGTAEVVTARGRHLYLEYPACVERIKSCSRQDLKIDIRGDGGYVVAPPSIHHSGKSYAFRDLVTPPAVCPDWLVEFANGNLVGHTIPGANTAREKAGSATLADDLTAGQFPPPHSEALEEQIRSALPYILAEDRTTWWEVGAALHWLSWGEAGYSLWTEWSLSCPKKFNEEDQRRTWEGYDSSHKARLLTIRSLYHKAREGGWPTATLESSSQKAFFRKTDLGNARRLVERHGQNIRYVHAWKKWVIWQGDLWSVDECGAIDELAKEMVESIHSDAEQEPDDAKRAQLRKHAINSAKAERLQALVKVARSEEPVIARPTDFDADPWLLGVANGTIELKTQHFRESRREDFITKRSAVRFDPSAQCPRWSEFLQTVMGGDRELASYLQRVIGYMLTGSVHEEILFVLYGTGCNGKSTFRETIHLLLGEYAVVSDAGLLISRNQQGAATPDVARLQGKRLVAINETAENDQLNEARVKFLTSNDMITARHLYGEPFDFVPTHKTFLTTNHRPVIKGTDRGIWRRIHLIPFTQQIEDPQKNFREEFLLPELPGILKWALEGLKEYLQRGLQPPCAVVAATEDYKQEMDVVGRWIDERCDLDAAVEVPTGELYLDYARWSKCEVGWEMKVLRFGRQLAERGFSKTRGSGGARCTRGLALKKPSPAMMRLGFFGM
jgi:putative DNA primase/helicase